MISALQDSFACLQIRVSRIVSLWHVICFVSYLCDNQVADPEGAEGDVWPERERENVPEP